MPVPLSMRIRVELGGYFLVLLLYGLSAVFGWLHWSIADKKSGQGLFVERLGRACLLLGCLFHGMALLFRFATEQVGLSGDNLSRIPAIHGISLFAWGVGLSAVLCQRRHRERPGLFTVGATAAALMMAWIVLLPSAELGLAFRPGGVLRAFAAISLIVADALVVAAACNILVVPLARLSCRVGASLKSSTAILHDRSIGEERLRGLQIAFPCLVQGILAGFVLFAAGDPVFSLGPRLALASIVSVAILHRSPSSRFGMVVTLVAAALVILMRFAAFGLMRFAAFGS